MAKERDLEPKLNLLGDFLLSLIFGTLVSVLLTLIVSRPTTTAEQPEEGGS